MKLLIVEDSRDLRQHYHLYFQTKKNYEVDFASNGREALQEAFEGFLQKI